MATQRHSYALPDRLGDLLTGLQDPLVVWEAGAIIASLLIAWLIARSARSELVEGEHTWRLAREGMERAVFPLTAALLVLAVRAALAHWQKVPLLNIAVPLLFSLLLVRIAIFLLRTTFGPASWVSTSERAIAWTIWIGFALHITGLLPDFAAILNDIGFSVGKQRITLLLILQVAFYVSITLVVAMTVARLIEGRIMGARQVDINLRVAVSKLVRAVLVVVALLIALPAVGVDLTTLSVFSGALGVGLGFGLQKIASNYVSGFIILLDRSLTIGDLISIDNRTGELTRMTTRYIVVRGMDGVEAIIPNDTVINSTVLNLTRTDRKVRVATQMQVGYATDLGQAMDLMLEAARAHPRVIADPGPAVALLRFGESGIDLELGVWIEDPESGQGNVRSDLLLAIWRRFRTSGIEVPFPQREIRIVSGTVPVAPGPTPVE